MHQVAKIFDRFFYLSVFLIKVFPPQQKRDLKKKKSSLFEYFKKDVLRLLMKSLKSFQ